MQPEENVFRGKADKKPRRTDDDFHFLSQLFAQMDTVGLEVESEFEVKPKFDFNRERVFHFNILLLKIQTFKFYLFWIICGIRITIRINCLINRILRNLSRNIVHRSMCSE